MYHEIGMQHPFMLMQTARIFRVNDVECKVENMKAVGASYTPWDPDMELTAVVVKMMTTIEVQRVPEPWEANSANPRLTNRFIMRDTDGNLWRLDDYTNGVARRHLKPHESVADLVANQNSLLTLEDAFQRLVNIRQGIWIYSLKEGEDPKEHPMFERSNNPARASALRELLNKVKGAIEVTAGRSVVVYPFKARNSEGKIIEIPSMYNVRFEDEEEEVM